MTRINERKVITEDNVKWLGEMIALMSAKSSDKMFCHSKVTQLYRGLISDIFYNNHNPNYTFRNGHDFLRPAHNLPSTYIVIFFERMPNQSCYKLTNNNFDIVVISVKFFCNRTFAGGKLVLIFDIFQRHVDVFVRRFPLQGLSYLTQWFYLKKKSFA